MTPATQRRRRANIALAAAVSMLAVGAAILHTFPPGENTFYPRCPFYALTGLLCPGCGATRALAALTHGDVTGALHTNALVVVLLPIFAVYGLAAYRRAATASAAIQIPARAIAAAVTIAFAFAMIRNFA